MRKKLIKCRNRKNSGARKNQVQRPASSTRVLSHKQALEQMSIDWAQGRKSVTIMGPYLEITRAQRLKESKKLKTLDLLLEYPALAIQELVTVSQS